jgi:methionyl-tRNA formyltransferase
VGVVTQPDRPAGRGHKLAPTPVKRAAEARGLPVFTPEKLKPFVDEARALGAAAFVVASYGKIVPQALLDVVPVAFNVHPSLLPLYRGATPLQSAIRDGRTQTGVTIIAMDAGMDTGDVLLQEPTPIGATETYGELHDRLARRGAELVVTALQQHADRTLTRTPQSEIARKLGVTDEEIARTLTRPLRKDDLQIDWSQPGRRIVDLVHSLAPQPLARTDYFDESLKIVEAHRVTIDELHEISGGGSVSFEPPGLAVVRGQPFVYVSTSDGAVIIDRLIAPNRGPMSAEAFMRSTFAREFGL